MPQVDLGRVNDDKVADETLAEGGDDSSENDVISDYYGGVDPDFPPESFWLSKDAEYDWFDRNAAAVYERKESTKANSNSTNLNPGSNSNSQRFTVNRKSKAAIIGLPKTQKTTFVDTKRRTCKPANIRLFPKRSESVGKSTVPMAEPGSPKVSCMGRVRSKRGRRRSSSLKRREKPVERSRSGRENRKKTGFYSKVMSMFRSKKGHRKSSSRSGSRKVAEVREPEPVVVEPRRKSSAEPPGLGGVKRFASGRRSDLIEGGA